MKKLLFYFLSVFILIGCGGGGGGDEADASSTYSSDAVGSTSYSASDYVLPKTSTPSGSSIQTRSYHATIRETDPNTYEEIPDNTTDEKIVYNKKSNGNIEVIFYKQDQEVYSYEMKGTLKIGEQSTVQPSACIVAEHFEHITLEGIDYTNVIEIDCGKHKGYYQKDKGFIAKE